MFFDPLYLLFALPGLALSLWAQFKVKSTFQKYSDVPARSGMTGARAAAELIRQRGVSGVRIEPTHGFLSDHYDPFHRVLRLSEDVYHGHRSEEHTSELQSQSNLVCRLLLEKKKNTRT